MVDTLRKQQIQARITCIEPYPKRLVQLKLDQAPEVTLVKTSVQDVDLKIFEDLDENDILFIDSSHVSKFQSDVNYEIFEIFPRLKKGVYIHIHDILYPFEYDQSWIRRGYSWNEAYVLRAFLSFNPSYSIQWFSHYMTLFQGEALQKKLPRYLINGGGSIWLKRAA